MPVSLSYNFVFPRAISLENSMQDASIILLFLHLCLAS